MFAVYGGRTMASAKFKPGCEPEAKQRSGLRAVIERRNELLRQREAKERARREQEAQRQLERNKAIALRMENRGKLDVNKYWPRPENIWGYKLIEWRICRALRVFSSELKGPGRNARVVMARQAIAYWARRRTNLSLPQIGNLMGGKDHTTILHSKRTYPKKRAAQGRYLPEVV